MIENVLDRDVLSFEIEKSNIDEKKVIGSFQKNTATIELLNPENKYSNLKGAYINTYKGTFFVNDISPIQEDIKIKLSCYDLTHKFDIPYENDKFVFPMTLKEWKNAICNELDVEYDDSDFPNSDYQLSSEPYIKKDATYKDVIKLIAQASSCWAIIDYDDKLYFNWFKDDNLVEVEDWFDLTTEDNPSDPVNIVVLGRGVVEDNVIYPETEPESPKEIRIDSNDILDIDRKGMIVPIYNQVNGFKYIVFNMKTRGFLNAKVGDKIKYPDLYGNAKESYIMRHTLTFLGGDYTDERNYTSKFEAVELDETNTNYKYAESPEQKLNRTERLANKLDGQILDVVETIDQYDSKISQVEQTVEEINQKVSEVADLTREVSGNKYIELNDAILGDLISLRITGEITILPNKYMFPSDDLFPHDAFYLKVTNEETDEESGETNLKSTRYKLPFYALHEYGDVKDEFIIDNEKVKLIKRIGVDENDDKYLLTQPVEQTFDDIVINLKDGYNRLELVDFPSATLSVKYAIQSEYSNVFVTKVELNSSITSTKDEINLQVSKKVDENEVIAAINLTSEEAKINANKIELEGYVTVTDLKTQGKTEINGSNITTGTLDANKVNVQNLNADNITAGSIKGRKFCGTSNESIYTIIGYSSSDTSQVRDNAFKIHRNDGSLILSTTGTYWNHSTLKACELRSDANRYLFYGPSDFATLHAQAFQPTSLESLKKNINKFKDGLSLIKETDVYSYNFKSEKNNYKKHIGVVIPDLGGNYKTSEEIINQENDGIDLYSMISVAWQAIKEQQNIIENLKNKIEVLENGK